METHRHLQGGLIIGVVWLLAEASWLHFLTLISGKPSSASFHQTCKMGREPAFTAFSRLHQSCSLAHTHSRFLHPCCFSTLTPHFTYYSTPLILVKKERCLNHQWMKRCCKLKQKHESVCVDRGMDIKIVGI